ncbi:MAG: prepilin-type N-terminal cleavage/methylation domain-containing protein [Myxococcota bacterium]
MMRTRTTERTRTSEAGFTLLEVLMAMVILGVGVLTIGVAQLSAIKMSSRSQHLSQAMYLAQEQMEVFMVLPQGSAFLTLPVVDAPDPAGTIDIDPNDNDLTNYTRTWTVEPNVPNPGVTRITITVTWNTATRGPTQVQLQGIRTS